MTLNEIKHAVEAGHTVHWKNPGYRVIKDQSGQWLIQYGQGSRAWWIGLTYLDGVTMNGEEADFYIA